MIAMWALEGTVSALARGVRRNTETLLAVFPVAASRGACSFPGLIARSHFRVAGEVQGDSLYLCREAPWTSTANLNFKWHVQVRDWLSLARKATTNMGATESSHGNRPAFRSPRVQAGRLTRDFNRRRMYMAASVFIGFTNAEKTTKNVAALGYLPMWTGSSNTS
jgi:hypothetical protein